MIIITLSIYIIFCFHSNDNMFMCVECGTRIDIDKSLNPTVVDCPACGTELELFEDSLIGLHLGPSEE